MTDRTYLMYQPHLDFAPDDPRPVLYLTNWSSRKLHGPGRRYTIMTKPRKWEHGDGVVVQLCPNLEDFEDLQEGLLSARAYRDRFEGHLRTLLCRGWLRPGQLEASDVVVGGRRGTAYVESGDTLLCACARGKFPGQTECHRAWAAPMLVEAGWRVILDGFEVMP